ncbi:MAG: hypothetical protein NC393_09145 [Clostridium sp.]|nr:hypothetical protein [Clostridium sp.]MCM1172278.1 hypothetical protein [Clostridium sp.]MCM1208701.1 hypothetical protein [Ruminococcus sp.]
MENTNSGKNTCIVIGGYMVVKSIINLVMGFGLGNVITLAVSVVLAFTLIVGVKYFNFITAAYLVVIFLIHVVGNITGHQWFYLAEGIIDVICAFLLVAGSGVRAHFDE